MSAQPSPYDRKACQAPKCRELSRPLDSDSRALGWMIWEGETLGGKQQSIAFCPVHAGRSEEAAQAQETGFDAECFTCMTRASQEWGDEFEGTEAAAEEWMEEHACDPDTRLIQPKVKAGAA